MQNVIAIAIAGAVGTLARYWLGGLVQARFGSFPLGTFTVNLVALVVGVAIGRQQ